MPIGLYFELSAVVHGVLLALILPLLAAGAGLGLAYGLLRARDVLCGRPRTRFARSLRALRLLRISLRRRADLLVPAGVADPVALLAGLLGVATFFAAYAVGYGLLTGLFPWGAVGVVSGVVLVAGGAFVAVRIGRRRGQALEWAAMWLFFATLVLVRLTAPPGEGALDSLSTAVVGGAVAAPIAGARLWGRPYAAFFGWLLISAAAYGLVLL